VQLQAIEEDSLRCSCVVAITRANRQEIRAKRATVRFFARKEDHADGTEKSSRGYAANQIAEGVRRVRLQKRRIPLGGNRGWTRFRAWREFPESWRLDIRITSLSAAYDPFPSSKLIAIEKSTSISWRMN
jgi:hypothetical protein